MENNLNYKIFKEKKTNRNFYLLEEDFNHPNYGEVLLLVAENDASVKRFVYPIFFDNLFEEL